MASSGMLALLQGWISFLFGKAARACPYWWR